LGEVLRKRGIIDSLNNLSGDLAEFLFCQAYPSWKRQRNSHPGFDAIDKKRKFRSRADDVLGKINRTYWVPLGTLKISPSMFSLSPYFRRAMKFNMQRSFNIQ
jgi:hypothetical protein